jgi:hypothetical protein
MSLAGSYYLPTTPPTVARLHDVDGAHSRNHSGSSRHSQGSSPDSVLTAATTPSISPNYQHGPPLLPKIRTQDVIIEPISNVGPRRHRRVLSSTRNPPGFVPYPLNRPYPLSRNAVDAPDCNGLISPISPASAQTPVTTPGLSSPIALTTAAKRKSTSGHSRSDSASSIDDATISRYGYPTYRQLPKYLSRSDASPVSPVDGASFVFPSYGQVPPVRVLRPLDVQSQSSYGAAIPSPQYEYLRVQSAQPSPVGFLTPAMPSPSSSTTLLNHLTDPIPAVNLVRTVNYGPTRGLHDYFWWDVRQLRSWSSFCPSTFNQVKGLTQLLKTPIPGQFTPRPSVPSSRLAPESETSLIGVINDIYAPLLNAALAISQGNDHMRLYISPEAASPGRGVANGPHFLANYSSDSEQTSSGSPRGRVVGIAKCFDRWNTGMRNEAPHRRVEYLKGIAHLQRCMREHSCRYGFIISEIELVCVRAGCDDDDDVPYFGYLELSSPIPTSESSASYDGPKRAVTPRSSDGESRSVSPSSSSEVDDGRGLGAPMTAALALYFLLMLSKAVPLPSQPSGHLNVGGLGALSRQRILPDPKDKWMPEPQTGEKREAKRVRGWIWPQDAWHRREGARPRSETKSKKSRK